MSRGQTRPNEPAPPRETAMDVVLFDFHVAGYHLEYTSRMAALFDDLPGDVDLTLLTTETTPRHEKFFPDGGVESLPGFRVDTDDREDPAYKRVAVREALAYLDGAPYDVVFVPESDDVLDLLHQYVPRHADLPPIVGTLTGQFFTEPDKHDRVTSVLSSPAGERAVLALHDSVFGRPRLASAVASLGLWATSLVGESDRKSIETGLYSYVRPYALANCLRRGVLDGLMVYSEEARAYVTGVRPATATTAIREIPDPTDPWQETHDLTRPAARKKLDLPDDQTVFLFFGMLREDKGIDVLLEALERYDGPECTVVLAGSPVDVTERDVAATASRSVATVRADFGFIPDADVPLYFFAADCVVTPHRPIFGPESTSGPFQKACASGRPIVGPAFGTFQHRTEEWNLGLTFDPASPADLARTLATFVERDGQVYDPETMRAYARRHTYEEHARQVYRMARDVVDGAGESA